MQGPEKITLTDGSPVTDDHKEINIQTGQQKGYVVLSEEERAKGFIKPLRHSYIHVGPAGPRFSLRDLTEAEQERFKDLPEEYRYIKYEKFPEEESGRYWTQKLLDSVDKGCGTRTTMNTALAETYARRPDFYGGDVLCRLSYPLWCGRGWPVRVGWNQ